MQDVRRDTSSRDSDRRADRIHRRAICVRQLRTAMVFGMCEGTTDGCRRLIESCQVGRGSAWRHIGSLSVRLAQQLVLISFQVIAWNPPNEIQRILNFTEHAHETIKSVMKLIRVATVPYTG